VEFKSAGDNTMKANADFTAAKRGQPLLMEPPASALSERKTA
jgi:hypothetical protein